MGCWKGNEKGGWERRWERVMVNVHSKKERAETTRNRVSIECPGIQHTVHTCCPVPVLF